jgi:prepilin-type N-terminal cleavage/methylation domain-containing protein
MNNFKPLLNNKGLTLVELMIVLVLSLLLMAAVYMTFQLQHASGQSQLQVTATQQDLRAVMEIIADDIMHAGFSTSHSFDPSNVQGIPTNTSDADTLQLAMNLPTGNIVVTYSLSADPGNLHDLQRTSGGIMQVLAHNVSALNFAYRGRQAAGTLADIIPGAGANLDVTQSQQVRYIRVTITKQSDQIDPQTGLRTTRTLERTVCRRNGVTNPIP